MSLREYFYDYYFPEDIVYEILLKLPVKSVIICSLVCKSWYSMIRCSAFIDTHLARVLLVQYNDQNKSNRHRFLILSINCFFCSLYGWWENHNYYNYNQPPYFYGKYLLGFSPKIVGTCNGLICVASFFDIKAPPIIWNPSVRKYMILPRPGNIDVPENSVVEAYHFFVYDSQTNDYKVLRILTDFSLQPPLVYSLARGSWKSLGAASTGFCEIFSCDKILERHVSVNGILHWIKPHHMDWKENFIVTFDIGTELFGEIMVPETLKSADCFISRYEESLALIENCYYISANNCTTRQHLWVMKEYGVMESWTKLDNSIRFQGHFIRPLGFKSHDERVMTISAMSDRKFIVAVDLKTKKLKKLGIDRNYSSFDPFVESLILLDQLNAVSY